MKIAQVVHDRLGSGLDLNINWRRMGVFSAIVFMVIFNLIAIGYLGARYYYGQRFYPGTKVAGINIGGKTLEEAKSDIQSLGADNHKRELVMDIAGQVYQASPEELGIKFDWEKTLNNAYYQGRTGGLWQQSKFMVNAFSRGMSLPLQMAIDDERFNEYLTKIVGSTTKPPADAYIKVVDGQFVISQASQGVGVDKVKLAKLVVKTAQNCWKGSQWSKLVYQAHALAPEVTEDKLVSAKSQAESMVQTPINFTFDNHTITASTKDMAKWIAFSKEGGTYQPVVNKEEVEKYVAYLAKRIDLAPIDKKVSTKDGATLEEGKDGRALSRTKTSQDILNAMAGKGERTIAMQVDPRPFSTKTVFPPFNPGLYDGKYVEVNISNQMMYLWIGTEKVAEYRVSTGKWSTPTPLGTRYILDKSPRAFSKKFGLYMPFWNGLGGGYGIHELPEWPGGYKEGASHIGTPVSHGCIRLGVGPAQMVYNWADIGTPVYIHK